ncbi:hypothetical protein, partial [Acinetobacter towneri]|uniref:hypothetical protein n=1 Tax=Acinetobacter towneri TaxID=202956 RepID=UPI002575C078
IEAASGCLLMYPLISSCSLDKAKPVSACGGMYTEERTQFAFNGYSPKWRYGDELMNKVIIFIFFVYKKYSRRFITFRLNH